MTDEKKVEAVDIENKETEPKLGPPPKPRGRKAASTTKKTAAKPAAKKPAATPAPRVKKVKDILPEFFKLREAPSISDKMKFEAFIKGKYPNIDHSDCDEAWIFVASYGVAIRNLEELIRNYHRTFIKLKVKGMDKKKASRLITRELRGNKLAKFIKAFAEGKDMNLWYAFNGDLDKVRRASRL